MNDVYLPDWLWKRLGDDAVHASAARIGVTARRYPAPLVAALNAEQPWSHADQPPGPGSDRRLCR